MAKSNNMDDFDAFDIDGIDGEDVKRNIERIKKKKKKKRKKKSTKKKVIIFAIIAVLAVLAIAFLFTAKRNVDYLKGRANDLKANLNTTIECIKNNDPDGAENAMVAVRDISDNISENLGFTFWKFMSALPVVSGDIDSVKEMLSILDEADEGVIMPFINQVRNNPFASVRAEGGGINTNAITPYLDFAETIAPQVSDIANRLSKVEFKIVKINSFEEYVNRFEQLAEGFESLDDFKALLNVFCGDGEDKTFLMMAQNTAEIRSCGGFPGACGLIVVNDGVLKVEAFGPVEDYISYGSTEGSGAKQEEAAIFGPAYISQERDARYNPHFPKVAEITKVSYETKTGNKIDGVVSLTPAIIQEILAITGETLTLDDGTVVNGENASMTLQHDLYYKYYTVDMGYMSNDDVVNSLFAQTATLTMSSMTNNMNVDSLVRYLAMFKNGFAKRTIMLWADNEADEDVLRSLGASGSLNYDANNPETGIFFSNSDASKMGMFVDINYELGEGVQNASGQMEYQMTVKISNIATENDLNISKYVKGSMEGTISSFIFLFAPQGGSISNVVYDNGVESYDGNIYGLDVAYVQAMDIDPSTTVTITYTITTAAGVTTPLNVVTTPTLQEYR